LILVGFSGSELSESPRLADRYPSRVAGCVPSSPWLQMPGVWCHPSPRRTLVSADEAGEGRIQPLDPAVLGAQSRCHPGRGAAGCLPRARRRFWMRGPKVMQI